MKESAYRELTGHDDPLAKGRPIYNVPLPPQPDVRPNPVQILEKKKEKELTTRQWRLFDLFKAHEGLIHNKDIADTLTDKTGDFYYPYDQRTKNFHNTPARRHITDDTHAIQMDNEIDDVIITDITMGSGIPTAEEYGKWIKQQKAMIRDFGEKIRLVEEKASRHNQYRFVLGYERPIIQAFRENGA